MKYPKINSLYNREGAGYTPEQLKSLTPEQKANRHRFTGEYASKHFENINQWLFTEKIDGMNVRIYAKRENIGDKWIIRFTGRTDNALLPATLFEYLSGHFKSELFDKVFSFTTDVILYGEGYGAKIQDGGYYAKDQRFCLFDILVGNLWIEYSDVLLLGLDLDIPVAPVIGTGTKEDAIALVKSGDLMSRLSEEDHLAEGIVARACPMLLDRNGFPIKFKLKVKDFK